MCNGLHRKPHGDPGRSSFYITTWILEQLRAGGVALLLRDWSWDSICGSLGR